jgi:hypothetical protein
MSAKNTLRQISSIIYKMKRQFGMVGTLRYPDNDVSTYDITTGVTDITYVDLVISRIIRLPRRNISDFVYDLAFIAANKNFTYGAEFDTNDRWFIIDVKDLTIDYRYPNPTKEITTEYYIIIEGRTYKVYACNLAEHNNAYLLRGREIVSSDTVS